MSAAHKTSIGAVKSAPIDKSEPLELVDLVAAVVMTVPGVADLSSGPVGSAATYLPGRRVAGVHVGDDHIEIHISVEWNNNVVDVADAVRAATRPLVNSPVDVIVEEVVEAS